MTTLYSQFHLAIPVHDLAAARDFYGNVMGCPEGRSSPTYVDFDFYGHHFVTHISKDGESLAPAGVGRFDGHEVSIPHFGLNLPRAEWNDLAARLKDAEVHFVEEPHVRLQGKPGEHATMFVRDPSGNALEFKSFHDPNHVFAR